MNQDPPDGLYNEAQPDVIDMMDAEELRRELRAKLTALHRIAECTDAWASNEAKHALANTKVTHDPLGGRCV